MPRDKRTGEERTRAQRARAQDRKEGQAEKTGAGNGIALKWTKPEKERGALRVKRPSGFTVHDAVCASRKDAREVHDGY